jgi:dTDP-4-amino-4,6-dideoxygalactose transaminase
MKVPFLDLKPQHAALKAELLEAFGRVLDRTSFCLGPDVEEFERAFAAASGAPECVALNNGTSALHAAALALGIGPGDEVIVPAFTFIATAWTATYIGAKPVFVDIEENGFTMDPQAFEAAITPRTKAVVPVHLFGQAARMAPILAIAARHSLPVIEDCAQAHLALCDGQPVGTLGDAGCFSFYPTKNLGGCGEGGALISRRPELLKTARVIRVHGSAERYKHEMVGYNYRMEGLQAAALSVKLRHLSAWTAKRQAIARRYREEIRLADLQHPAVQPQGESVYHQYTVLHPRRDALRASLSEAGVGTDLIYPRPLHLQPCYESLGVREGTLPRSEAAARQCLSLPIHPDLSEEQVSYVIASVNRFQ